jgi:hypothetical protein
MPKHVLVIDLGEQSPTRSICLPSDLGEQPSSIGLRGISTREVYQASEVASTAGGLLPHLFTLTTLLDRCLVAVSLSAALAVRLPLRVLCLPVKKRGALCCPDFPP